MLIIDAVILIQNITVIPAEHLSGSATHSPEGIKSGNVIYIQEAKGLNLKSPLSKTVNLPNH